MQSFKKLKFNAVLLIAVFISTIAILATLALHQVKQTTLTQIQDTLQALLFTAQESHHILVEQRRISIESVAESQRVMQLTEQLLTQYENNHILVESPVLKELRRTISPVIKNLNDEGFFVIAPDRVSIASMRDENIGTINLIQLQHQQLLTEAFEGNSVFIPPTLSDVKLTKLMGTITHSTSMFIVTPIKNTHKKVIAALAFRINPRLYFSKIATLGRVGQSGETYAFDQQGTLLTQSRFIKQLKTFGLISSQQQSVYNVKLKDPGGNLLNGFKPIQTYDSLPFTFMATQALQGIDGINITGYRDYRGVNVYGAWLWDTQYQFGLATEINADEALASYYKTRNTFIIVISITAILCLLLLITLRRTQRNNEQRILDLNEQLECRVRERTYDLNQAKDKLVVLNDELEAIAKTDSLTKISNRRHFDEQLAQEWQRCLRDKKSLGVIIFDIDYFKQYNDHYGHQAGDRCLQSIGEFLSKTGVTRRPGDIVARYGGEEFIMLLTNPSIEYCRTVAQYLCDGIRDLNISHDNTPQETLSSVTISAGFSRCANLKEHQSHQLIKEADEALYSAKQAGRNTIFEYIGNKGKNITSIHRQKHKA